MRATLDGNLPPLTDDPLARAVRHADAPGLAALMLAAYRGTVDDGGEGPDEAAAEIDRLLGGAYGPFDWASSELVERDGRIVASTLVTAYESRPLIAFSITDPAWQRRGLARAGLLRTMSRLHEAGERDVWLAVTAANTRAVQLYRSLGFEEVP